MYTEVLRSIEGIAIFPVVSLVTFVIVFAIVLVRAARLDSSSLNRFARLPLEEGSASFPSARGRNKESVREARP